MKNKIYRLSAIWMLDHLDVWAVDAPKPEGQYRGNVWVGELSEAQKSEIIDRAKMYAIEPDYRKFCPEIQQSAKRVLKVLGAESTPRARKHWSRL